MTQTLSFGYKKPEDGDKGDPVFTALEDNIDQINIHKHNGTNSDRVESYNLTRNTVAVPSTGWSADDQLYKQTVTFPSGFSTANSSEWGNAPIRFFMSGGTLDTREFFPKTVRLSDTTFELHMPVNNQAVNVLFG